MFFLIKIKTFTTLQFLPAFHIILKKLNVYWVCVNLVELWMHTALINVFIIYIYIVASTYINMYTVYYKWFEIVLLLYYLQLLY